MEIYQIRVSAQNRFMHWFPKMLLLLLAATALAYFFWYRPKFNHRKLPASASSPVAETRIANVLRKKLERKAFSLRQYAKENHYNSERCFLVDMSIASGKPRFFVYNLAKDSVEKSGLVTHGMGGPGGGIEYSNTEGSNCTSKGRYSIGQSYNGRFGLAFKLHGLDKTNSNAFKRFVVLHAHDCVPDAAVYPVPICESQGCPTVSPAFLQELKVHIEQSEKPVLLTIFE